MATHRPGGITGNGHLYIAAKAPRPGLVKTRLGAGIGHATATALYTAFLRDLGARFEGGPFRLGWYVTPDGAWSEIGPLVGAGTATAVRLQPDGDWSHRQRHLLETAAAEGERPVVLIASDSPHLTTAYVADAFRALHDHDVVLGPTYDGGYALIGMRGWHDVLDGVVMSTSDVASAIRRRAHALGLRVHLLPPTFDVDEPGDLDPLLRTLAIRDDLPATAAAVAANGCSAGA
ncbi:MAG: TIGR04282 family arsenosugar biosynthesis glycosyltransferase [Candidatus Dormiibacterota bacterium]